MNNQINYITAIGKILSRVLVTNESEIHRTVTPRNKLATQTYVFYNCSHVNNIHTEC